MSEKKPYFVAVFIQLAYTGYFMTSKAAFDKGMSTFVFIFYRHIAASLLLASLAVIFQRKSSTPLTFTISLKLFLHAIIGIPLSLNLYNTGLKYTSASVASAIANCSPVFTFSIAVLFRREIFRTKRLSGISKVLGITLCLIGVLIVALYKGPHWSLHHHLFGHNQRHRNQEPVLPDKRWIEGTLLMITSAMATSLWLVLQGFLLKEYPPKLLFTTIECLFGTLQSLVVALVFERDSSKWKLHLDMGFLAILYCCIAGIYCHRSRLLLTNLVSREEGTRFLVHLHTSQSRFHFDHFNFGRRGGSFRKYIRCNSNGWRPVWCAMGKEYGKLTW
ncbi:WAT1-related protein At5g64700-like isoform X2 [Zingiber officinale]|uniref:WAT1-related protein At5g64700-like isoform X2 n=1 Tax=Zingiber officinale TaxID=94328 RepID=UPI001C4D97FE|nr:WAT1-related protein At5g64700-like isoform X2 [Zingiber officinale]